jgi:hypothetical protein
VAESRSLGPVPSDLVLNTAMKATIELYGDSVPATCPPKYNYEAPDRSACDYGEHDYFCDRFAPLKYARTNGDTQKSEAQKDVESAQGFLSYFVCRYAISKSRFDLLRSSYRDLPLVDRFGIFKIIFDQNNLPVCRWLLGRPDLEDQTCHQAGQMVNFSLRITCLGLATAYIGLAVTL